MSKPTRIVTFKVAPDKLKAILDRPPPFSSVSPFNPNAATPASPIQRRSNRARQITTIAAASGAQGNALYTDASFAASFSNPSSPPLSPSPKPVQRARASLAIASSPIAPFQRYQLVSPTASSQIPQTVSPVFPAHLPSPSITSSSDTQQSTSATSGTTSAVEKPYIKEVVQRHSIETDDPDTVMAEKENQKQPAATTGAAPANGEGGTPFYEAQRKHLQKLLEKKRKLTESIANREELIERKEAEYLESTPAGNILMGFDNYTKGSTQAAAAQRRKGIHPDQYKVFSRSSVTYNPLAMESGANTPGSSHAPTPVSSTFGGTNHPTPTTIAGGSARAAGGAAPRDRKKKGVVIDAGDSESDAREVKKVRTNFGAGRK